jgi:hypothetical protein
MGRVMNPFLVAINYLIDELLFIANLYLTSVLMVKEKE